MELIIPNKSLFILNRYLEITILLLWSEIPRHLFIILEYIPIYVVGAFFPAISRLIYDALVLCSALCINTNQISRAAV